MMMRTFIPIVAALCLVGPASAATYNFTLNAFSGTFEAPEGGGLISAFSVTIGSTVFDALDMGNLSPVYTPILNTFSGLKDVEFGAILGQAGAVYNSVASAECPGGQAQCVLQLFNTAGGTHQPEFLAFNTDTFQNLSFGHYAIDPVPVMSPVPLPATIWLLAAALAVLTLRPRQLWRFSRRTVVA